MCVYVPMRAQSCLTATPWLLCPWDFLGKDTGIGCYFLLQGSNLCFLHWQADSLPLNYHWEVHTPELPPKKEAIFQFSEIFALSTSYTSSKRQGQRLLPLRDEGEKEGGR